MKDAGDKIKDEEKKEIEEAMKALKEVKDKEGATVESIDVELKKASDALSKYGERLYKASAESQTPPTSGEQKAASDDSQKGPEPEGGAEEGEVVDEKK